MVATHSVSATDLEGLTADGFRYELIAGELVRMTPAKAKHGYVESEFAFQLKSFVRPRGLGEVFGASSGYQFSHRPDTVLAPDVSFIRQERLPTGNEWEEYLQVVPDLVVEV